MPARSLTRGPHWQFANKFGNTQHALTGERRACDALRSDLRRLRKVPHAALRPDDVPTSATPDRRTGWVPNVVT